VTQLGENGVNVFKATNTVKNYKWILVLNPLVVILMVVSKTVEKFQEMEFLDNKLTDTFFVLTPIYANDFKIKKYLFIA